MHKQAILAFIRWLITTLAAMKKKQKAATFLTTVAHRKPDVRYLTMTVALPKILSKKADIVEKVEQFGFSNDVRIGYGSPFFNNREILHIIVKQAEGVNLSYKVPSFLKTQLIDMIQCEVNVLVYDNVEKLYQETLKKTSASLQEGEIEEFFGTELSSISFSEANFDDVQKELLDTSNVYLKSNQLQEKKIIPKTDFFSKTKRPLSPQEVKRIKNPRLVSEPDDTVCLVIPLCNEEEGEILMRDKNFIDEVKMLSNKKLVEIGNKTILTSKC